MKKHDPEIPFGYPGLQGLVEMTLLEAIKRQEWDDADRLVSILIRLVREDVGEQ